MDRNNLDYSKFLMRKALFFIDIILSNNKEF